MPTSGPRSSSLAIRLEPLCIASRMCNGGGPWSCSSPFSCSASSRYRSRLARCISSWSAGGERPLLTPSESRSCRVLCARLAARCRGPSSGAASHPVCASFCWVHPSAAPRFGGISSWPPRVGALSATRCRRRRIRPWGSVSFLRKAAPSLHTASMAKSRGGSLELGRCRRLLACASTEAPATRGTRPPLSPAPAASCAGCTTGASSSPPPCPKTSGSDMSASPAIDGGFSSWHAAS